MYRLDEATHREIPEKFGYIFGKLKNYISNQHQHVAIVLHYLMIEVGFHLLPSSSENINDAITPGHACLQNNGAGYRFKYSINNNDVICMLQILPNGANITIVGTFGGQPQMSFRMDEEITDRYLLNINSQTFPSRFKNLKVLSKEFKNNIAFPLLSHLKNSLDLPPGTESLEVLSNEEILLILGHLKCPKSIVNFGTSSIRFNELSQKNSIWKDLVKEHFPRDYDNIVRESNENGEVVVWKDHYKRIHRNRESRQNAVMYQPLYQVFPVPIRPVIPMIPLPRPNIGPFRPRYDPPF